MALKVQIYFCNLRYLYLPRTGTQRNIGKFTVDFIVVVKKTVRYSNVFFRLWRKKNHPLCGGSVSRNIIMETL